MPNIDIDVTSMKAFDVPVEQAATLIIETLCNFGPLEDPKIPTEDEKWKAIRKIRTELIALSDYAMLPDAPPYTQAQVDAIAVYRQALRDIPQNYQVPESVVFPIWPI